MIHALRGSTAADDDVVVPAGECSEWGVLKAVEVVNGAGIGRRMSLLPLIILCSSNLRL